jgi:hypothetical protein
MAAEATFTLRAVDATKQAFASVQNSLQGLAKSSQLLSRAIMTGFGVGSVFGIINALVGKITDRMDEVKKIEEQIDTILKRQVETQKELYFQKQKPTDQLDILEKEKAAIQKNLDMYKETAKWRQIIVGPQTGYMLDKSKRQTSTTMIADLTPEQRLKAAQLGEEYSLIQNKIDAINESLNKQKNTDAESARISRIKTLNEVLKTSEDAFDAMLSAQQKLNAEYRSGKDKETAEKKSRQAIADSLKSQIDPLYEFQARMKEIEDLTNDGLLTEEQYYNAISLVGSAYANALGPIEDMTSRLGAANEEAKKAIPAMSQLAKISDDAGSIIAQGFEDAILSGQKLQEVIKAIGRDLLRMVFQQTITQPLAAGISGALQGMFRANGGPVSANSPYVVGERGPELFVPRASGSIVSNSNMNQGGGSAGPSINVNYNIAAGVTRNELGPILEQERRRLKAEIPDMVRRGGAYRSAFA